MSTREHDADFQGSYFALEIEGVTLAWFTGCSGLSLELDVIEFKQGDGATITERKRAGKDKYSEVVLKRGFTVDTALHDWFRQVSDGAEATPYKTGSIVIYDRLKEEGARFNMENMWPSKLSVSDLKADSDDVMVEELTIQHELLDWV
jgi:phage tail-like protein